MGGQACVFYGAAEFSRDLDLLVLADPESLAKLSNALEMLEAEPVAVPVLGGAVLDRGHAVHFRCRREDVAGLRIDLMSRLRGSDDFEQLWDRRTTILVETVEIDMLAIEDLVRAKKTQRDKDWPMIRRLVEQAYFSLESQPDAQRIDFLLRELRTPELLLALVRQDPEAAARIAPSRRAVEFALSAGATAISEALEAEEALERRNDRTYWAPLKLELEQMRRNRRKMPN